MSIFERLLKPKDPQTAPRGPKPMTATVSTMAGHVCMVASLVLLMTTRDTPDYDGDLIKGLVLAGVVCYILGKVLERK